MGQALDKLTKGREEKKEQEIAETAANYYDTHLASKEDMDYQFADFYQAVCEAVEELNKKMGSTQMKVPDTAKLKQVFHKHHKTEQSAVTKVEFEKMIQEVVIGTGVTGIGAKDLLLYIFGVPITALLIKRRVIPKAIPEEMFIPAVTSATVFALAMLNKL